MYKGIKSKLADKIYRLLGDVVLLFTSAKAGFLMIWLDLSSSYSNYEMIKFVSCSSTSKKVNAIYKPFYFMRKPHNRLINPFFPLPR